MLKRRALFDDTGHLTNEGQQLDQAIGDLLLPIFTTAVSQGYDIRELAHLMSHSVFSCENQTIINQVFDTKETN